MEVFKHSLAVGFGGVGIGDHTATIPIGFDLSGHSAQGVFDVLCGKRVSAYLTLGEPGHPDQQTLPGTDLPGIVATADCPRISLSPKRVAGRLTFSLEEVDTKQLGAFAKRTGTLRFNVLGPIPEKEAAEAAERRDLPGQQRLPEPVPVQRRTTNRAEDVGAGMPIEELAKMKGPDGKLILTAGKCTALRESELEIGTVGKLESAMRTDPLWHKKIKGMGPAYIDKVADALLKFRQQYPIPDPDDVAPTDIPEDKPQPEIKPAEPAPFETNGQAEPPPTMRQEVEADERAPSQWPDRNGDGTDVSGIDQDVLTELAVDDWAIVVHTCPGRDGAFHSCIDAVIGDSVGGRDIPIEESEPHRSRDEAARAAVLELADEWKRYDDPKLHAIADRMVAWAGEKWPAEDQGGVEALPVDQDRTTDPAPDGAMFGDA